MIAKKMNINVINFIEQNLALLMAVYPVVEIHGS
jgi:hypothetical protein